MDRGLLLVDQVCVLLLGSRGFWLLFLLLLGVIYIEY